MPGPRLSEQERYRIEAMWLAGLTFPEIAIELGRDRSTIWREVRRNHSFMHGVKHRGLTQKQARRADGRCVQGLYRWGYHASRAHERARTRARRPRQVKLGFLPHRAGAGWGKGFARGRPTALRTIVVGKLAVRWSPQQIAGWLADNFAGYPELQVSHETIYQALYVQSRGALRDELTKQVALRTGRVRRSPRTQAAGPIRSRRPWTAGFNISTRPPEAADRAVPGHWEGDLVIGARGASAIITLVERSTRYAMLGHLPTDRGTDAVTEVLTALAERLPAHLRGSLTWDCGIEMAAHARFSVATGCPVYFADPHSPWQRGSNENTNGLLRQYYPKGVTDFTTLSQGELDAVAQELNDRPRRTLAWKTPRQALNGALVATTG